MNSHYPIIRQYLREFPNSTMMEILRGSLPIVSKETVFRSLKGMVDKGFITKEEGRYRLLEKGETTSQLHVRSGGPRPKYFQVTPDLISEENLKILAKEMLVSDKIWEMKDTSKFLMNYVLDTARIIIATNKQDEYPWVKKLVELYDERIKDL